MSYLIFTDQASWMRYCEQHPGAETAALYRRLVDEEIAELREAYDAHMRAGDISTLTEVADACIDSIYVIVGLMHALDLDPQSLWDEVHRSNIAKIRHPCTSCGATGVIAMDGEEAPCPTCKGQGHVYEVRRRDDGKVLKPDGWQPPSLYPLVEAQTSTGNAR